MRQLRQYSLLLSLIAAIGLAWLTPEWGAKGGLLRSEILIWIGVVWIFLTQGFLISSKALWKGLASWPIHLFSQSWIFLGMPLLALLGLAIAGDRIAPGIRLGVTFLAILPTTIASAIALISHARGNVGAAIFNTVCANLSAIAIIPLWLLLLDRGMPSESFDIGRLWTQLLLLVLLPFACGHAFRAKLLHFETRMARVARPLQQSIIVFMVYAAFATSFHEEVWTRVGWPIALQALLLSLALLIVGSALILLTARRAFRSPADRIAVFFLSSQKSLAVGIPYSVACFASLQETAHASMQLSVIILPLICYHSLQLMLAGIILRYSPSLFGSPPSPNPNPHG